MGDTKQDVVLECKNCLKGKKHIINRMHPAMWIAIFAVMCVKIIFLDYPLLSALISLSAGDLAGSAGQAAFLISLALLVILITGLATGVLITDFKRRDYWLFVDKSGRLHCDTVTPKHHEGKYYWQPLGNDMHLLENGQTLSHEHFEIPSALINWRVGGLSRSRGHIYHYHHDSRSWLFDGDNVVSALLPPSNNRSHWMHAYIALKNLNNGSAITFYLSSFLRLTVKYGTVINEWLSGNDIPERIAKLLLVEAKDKTATENYDALGRFLVKMREMASKWPENSDYAKAMRKATDEFLATMPDDDVKAWRRLEINEITGEPVSAANAPAENQPPEPPSDAAYCYSAEQIEQMKADLPQRKGI